MNAKRALEWAVAAVMALSLAGCGGAQDTPQAEVKKAESPEAAIEIMKEDITQTSDGLIADLETAIEETGGDYDSYTENKQELFDWFDLAVTETEEMGKRLCESERAYFELVAETVDHDDEDALQDAIEDFQRDIYDRAMEDYYDAVYEDAFETAYDAFYNDILDDAPHSEYEKAGSEYYEEISDGMSGTYEALVDARDGLYDDALAVYEAFGEQDFDLDAVFARVDEETEETDGGEENGETAEQQSASSADDAGSVQAETAEAEVEAAEVSPDFKKTMDDLEAVFSEYVDFMNAYIEEPSSTELLSRYDVMVDRYSDAMDSFQEIDADDLSAADYAYYFEVYEKITKKLAEVQG